MSEVTVHFQMLFVQLLRNVHLTKPSNFRICLCCHVRILYHSCLKKVVSKSCADIVIIKCRSESFRTLTLFCTSTKQNYYSSYDLRDGPISRERSQVDGSRERNSLSNDREQRLFRLTSPIPSRIYTRSVLQKLSFSTPPPCSDL